MYAKEYYKPIYFCAKDINAKSKLVNFQNALHALIQITDQNMMLLLFGNDEENQFYFDPEKDPVRKLDCRKRKAY